MRLVGKDQLEGWGVRASDAFLEKSVPLNDSIVKIASENILNQDQVKRVSEFANITTNIELFEKSSDKRFEFAQANPDIIWRRIANTGEEKTASLHPDYLAPHSYRNDKPMEKLASAEEITCQDLETIVPGQWREKVAVAVEGDLEDFSQTELVDYMEKLNQAISEIEVEKLVSEATVENAEDEIYEEMKQALLSGDSDYKEVCAWALQSTEIPSEQRVIKEALLKSGYRLCENDLALDKTEVVKLAGSVPEEFITDAFDSPGAPVMVRNGNLNMYYTLDTLVKQKERVADYDKPLLHLNDSVRYVKRKLVNY